jgi:hypothetical protein
MNLRQAGAYALLANAVIGVLLTIAALVGGGDFPAPVTVIQLLAFLLLIVGLPAIWRAQPQTGRLGQLGLVLMGLGSAIAFVVVSLILAGGAVPEAAPFASALAAGLGGAITGWLAVRAGVFPTWVGWLLLASSVLNFAFGLVPGGAFTTVVSAAVGLASAAAIGGFGWHILKGAPSSSPQTASARA